MMRGMDDKQLHRSDTPAFRSFRICLDKPQRPTTILGVIRRVAAEQAQSGRARAIAIPRRTGAFA